MKLLFAFVAVFGVICVTTLDFQGTQLNNLNGSYPESSFVHISGRRL